MRISDWSSDVCSSDLCLIRSFLGSVKMAGRVSRTKGKRRHGRRCRRLRPCSLEPDRYQDRFVLAGRSRGPYPRGLAEDHRGRNCRSEEHTSELQSLMRISYAVFCLKKKKQKNNKHKEKTR